MMSIQESSRRVYRYRIPLRAMAYVSDWVVGAVPIAVALHDNDVDVWADVPRPDAPPMLKTFVIAATGDSVPIDMKFLGSLFRPDEYAPDGRWVFHVFHDPTDGLL